MGKRSTLIAWSPPKNRVPSPGSLLCRATSEVEFAHSNQRLTEMRTDRLPRVRVRAFRVIVAAPMASQGPLVAFGARVDVDGAAPTPFVRYLWREERS